MLAPVLGDEGKAGSDRSHRVTELQRLAEGGHCAAVRFVDAHDRSHDLGAASSDEARQSKDFSAADLEAHVFEGSVAGESFDSQDRIADLRIQLGEELINIAADHVSHELSLRGSLQVTGRHVGAVAHDRHVVAQVEDFFHPVRDEHEGGSLIAQ